MMRKLGVSIIVQNCDSFLVGCRGWASRRGVDCWAFPGGMVEDGETITAAVKRELVEETGLGVILPSRRDINFDASRTASGLCVPGVIAVTDHLEQPIYKERHLTLWVLAEHAGGVPHVLEPSKCYGWEWKSIAQLTALPNVHTDGSEQCFWLPMTMLEPLLWQAVRTWLAHESHLAKTMTVPQGH